MDTPGPWAPESWSWRSHPPTPNLGKLTSHTQEPQERDALKYNIKFLRIKKSKKQDQVLRDKKSVPERHAHKMGKNYNLRFQDELK